MKIMKNLKYLAFCGAVAAMTGAAGAQDTITLKIADQFPLTHIGSKLGIQAVKAGVEEKSGGEMQIQLFPAEQISKAAGLLDAVRNRVTDMAMVGVVYNTDKLPLTSAAELPGMIAGTISGNNAFNGYIREDLLEREYLKLGVRPLYGTLTPPYQMMFAEGGGISDIAELEGMKLRVAGATGELIAKSLGAVPVKVPASDLYLALQRGTVNGAIYNAPSVFGYKIEEVLSAVSNNASLGSVAFAFLINEDVWKGLTPEQQTILQEVANETQQNFARTFDEFDRGSYGKLEEAGVTVFSFPPATLAAMDQKLGAVRDEWVAQVSARGLPAQDMLEAFRLRAAEPAE